MAFVGISQKLVGDVRDACRRMCSAELGTVGECGYITLNDDSVWYRELAYGEHMHLMGQVPKEWTKMYRGHGSFSVNAGEGEVIEVSTYCDDAVRNMPPSHRDYRSFTVGLDNPRLPQEVTEYVHKARERKAIEQRWNAVSAKVTQFLESCKSLNEAIKLWPEVEHYIPKDYISRLFAKREKSASESRAMEVLGGIDTQELTAAVVIARLSGATV